MTWRRPRDIGRGRQAGVLVPLASLSSSRSWGIGELGDIEALAAWLQQAGFELLQLLPLNELAAGQSSPYSAISGMAIDPVYIGMSSVHELSVGGRPVDLSPTDASLVTALRAGTHLELTKVRALKRRALSVAFARFDVEHWGRQTARALEFSRYVKRQAWWLDDHALFRAIQDEDHPGLPWTGWPPELRHREPAALAAARTRLDSAVRFHKYCQWIAESEWQRARMRSPVKIIGDYPFSLELDSVDVWAHQDDFLLDATVGAPPDAFSGTGQDWGLPAYRWDRVQAQGFAWLHARARRCAALFDGFRVDHIAGFYRTYIRPRDGGAPYFDPSEETEQRLLGEQVVSICRSVGTFVTAEDLGVIPDVVRTSLAELGVPGYRVLRWERRWDDPARPFIEPERYPANSVATSGTHDTSTLAGWWDEADVAEREQLLRLVDPRGERSWENTRQFDADLRDVLLERLLASGSTIVILPIQDLFGWRDRINVPNTVSERNWTFRIPWPLDTLAERPEAADMARQLFDWCVRYGRMARG